MIRWKQAEIYRERRERKDKIETLKLEITLNNRVVEELGKFSDADDKEVVLEKLNKLKGFFSNENEKFQKHTFEMRWKQRDSRWR